MSASNSENVFSKMLKIQLIATLVVAALSFVVAGLNGAVSATFGGASVLIGALAASAIARRGSHYEDATAILLNLLKAEAAKIIVIISLLIVIFKMYAQLVPFALIAGLAAAALFSGAALSKLKV